MIKSISPSDQLDAATCLAITHLISWSAPREQHLIVQEWHMLISPYICPPVLLVYNQSYSRRVKKFCISSDVHPLGHSPKLHCIDSMKDLIACLTTVHANIHIYYAQKLFSYKKYQLWNLFHFSIVCWKGGEVSQGFGVDCEEQLGPIWRAFDFLPPSQHFLSYF